MQKILGFAWSLQSNKCSKGPDLSHTGICGSHTLCLETLALRVITSILKEVSCGVINTAEVSQLMNFKKFGVWALSKEDPIWVPRTLEAC